jgi:AraC-like DNA-binding protein
MELLAHVRIIMWEGAALWLIDATRAKVLPRRTDFHAHHAIQVTLSLGGEFRLATADLHVPGDGVAVAPDVEHVFEAEGLMAFVFIEPESRAGRAVAGRLFGAAPLAAVPTKVLKDFRDRLATAYRTPARDNAALVDLGRALVEALGGGARAEEPDSRIRKVLAWASQQIDEPVGLSDAVAVSGLSASRLRHLFVEQTGLPFKTYLLWLRLTRAVERYASGAALTQAAHEAGFSDSAHLSRTFRRMFGVAPAALKII